MGREIDLRDNSISRTTPAREIELRSTASSVSDELPGAHRVRISRFDDTTGNPAEIVSESAAAESGNYVLRALNHIHSVSRVLGLTATQPVEFTADPDYQTTSSGAVTVHLQQQYKGIPIFQSAETVRFAPNGTIKEVVGSSVSVFQEEDVSPQFTVLDAVLKAAEHVAEPGAEEQNAVDEFGEPLQLVSVDLSGFQPRILTAYPEKPERPTVFEAGPFGDKIKARLIWFLLNETLRLSWEIQIALPDYAEQYRTFVDAETGEILYCRQLVNFISARGNIYRQDGSQARQMTDFPRPLADYGLPIDEELVTRFPDNWVSTIFTEGNNVYAHLGATGLMAEGSMQGGVLTFNPADSVGDEQKVLNIFYYNCVMHDFFYLLGFREVDGNFQQDNFGLAGRSSDRVDARAYSGLVNGTANMATPIDGMSPIMKMGLVASTGRHTAFDSSVVFHEFTHGVTNRLVGGPMNTWALEAHQSGGMGEGWSDYIACTINNSIIVGDWVTGQSTGIRDFPYNSAFPDNFGDLGTGRYSGFGSDGNRWPHPIGEIWCATLLEMNRNVGSAVGAQLVVDALKRTVANPGFLDARDAILEELDNKLTSGQLSADDHHRTRRGVWQAFAKFGMGPDAQSNGASLSGIVADFNMPALEEPEPQPQLFDVLVEASPDQSVPDNQAAGVSSVVNIAQSGQISRLTVNVNIQHTYIGDLRVSLMSPSGSTVILHNRSGASADDLVRSYVSDEFLPLGALLGEQVQGDWTLHVADLAGLDNGVLRHWGLGIDLERGAPSVHGEAMTTISIPDRDPAGISSSINIRQSGVVQSLTINLDITHTYIGDLRVLLESPSGQQILLHDRFGGSADNLIRSYDSNSHPALAVLVGESIQGDWVLRVADLVGQDVGKLNRWSLDLVL